jgi:hypothetical protein
MGKRHSVIVGMTRSGKTYFTKHVLKNLQSQGYHTVFFDPKHDDDYADLGEVCTTPVEFYAKLLKKVPRIVYRPSPKKDERADELSRIIEMMFSLGKKPGFKRMRRIVAIDEIQLMVKKGTNDGVEMLWTIGAGMGIVGIAITQRVQLLNETCWSQSENKILFKTDDRPEYLRSRNLDHYSDQRDFFLDSKNRYYYYATTGDGKWKVREPVSDSISSNVGTPPTIKPPSKSKGKPIGNLKTQRFMGLKRW